MNIFAFIFVTTSNARVLQYNPWATTVNSNITSFYKLCMTKYFITKIYYFLERDLQKKTFAQFYKGSNMPTGDYMTPYDYNTDEW